MPDMDAPSTEFTQWVRNLLAHLYDYPYLQNHPLALRLYADAADNVTRAQRLRRALLDCLEHLQPQAREDVALEANRAYAVLTYRYVDGLSMAEVAGELALSQRQTYREHDKGIKAVARLLWDRIHKEERASTTSMPAPDSPGDRSHAAQEEAERLGRAVQAEALELPVVLGAVLQVVEPLARQKGIRLALQLPDRPCSAVWADRTVLRQVLLNLLGYALESGSHGELTLVVRQEESELFLDIQRTPTDGRMAGTSAAPDRSEVNLEVARNLIQAQGGRLEAGPGRDGWRASVTLPIQGKVTILVIDDNEGLIALLQRYLGGHQVSVIGCSDGEQALRLARETRPQAILLDIMMPSVDGWELLQRLKSAPQTQDTPVIICSVLNHAGMALSLGASDYLVKPVSQADLLEALRRRLGPLPPLAPPPAEPLPRP